MPEYLNNLLAPIEKKNRFKKAVRRIFCMIEGHPTASWDSPNTDILTCDWCGATWKEKRPEGDKHHET